MMSALEPPVSPKVDKGKARALPGQGDLMLDERGDELFYRNYEGEEDLYGIMRLVEKELSEPYNLYTFRCFVNDWPHLTFLVFPHRYSPSPIACVVCKQDSHRGRTNRGYVGMLTVERAWRRRGIASRLVRLVIEEMQRRGAHEVVLETEYDNRSSLSLYDSLGFLREKRLHRFYSNGKDAFRLILPLPQPTLTKPPETDDEAERNRWLVGCIPEENGGQPGLGPIPEGGEDGEGDIGPHLHEMGQQRSATPRPAEREEASWYI